MAATCLVFLMVWIAYVWSCWTGGKATAWKGKSEAIWIDAPVLKKQCSTKEVPCIDDCSFLCMEKEVACVGGVCQLKDGASHTIPCSEKTGLRMRVQDPVPHTLCLCTDARFYGGPACDRLNPDVCEKGVFFYFGRLRYVCVCSPPYVLIRINDKPHCLEKKWMRFYDPATMNQNIF